MKLKSGIVWFLAIILVFTLLAVGSADSETESTYSDSTSKPISSTAPNNVEDKPTSEAVKEVPSKPDLEVLNDSYKSGEYSSSIIGSVKNNTNKTYSYVQVEYNLYDDSGAQVGSTFANVNNLEPGGTWKFEAIILEENAKSYKLKDVSGW